MVLDWQARGFVDTLLLPAQSFLPAVTADTKVKEGLRGASKLIQLTEVEDYEAGKTCTLPLAHYKDAAFISGTNGARLRLP